MSQLVFIESALECNRKITNTINVKKSKKYANNNNNNQIQIQLLMSQIKTYCFILLLNVSSTYENYF